MVDDLGNRIDVAQEHVANVNTRMKVRFTLEGAATVSVYFAPAVYFNQLTCCTRCQDFFFFILSFLVVFISAYTSILRLTAVVFLYSLRYILK